MKDRGIECPNCGCRMSTVIRTTKAFSKKLRRRLCRHCGRTFVTVETVRGAKPDPSQ